MNLDKFRTRANANRVLAVFLFILAGLTVVHAAVTYTPETGMHAAAWFGMFLAVANFLLLVMLRSQEPKGPLALDGRRVSQDS